MPLRRGPLRGRLMTPKPSDSDGWDSTLDEMVRTGSLNERLDDAGVQQFSLSGKGLLEAQQLIRRLSGQPDACRCEYVIYPAGGGDWGVLVHKPKTDCEWHIEAVRRLVRGTISDDDRSHALLFVYALDERRCNACGKPATRTTPGGTRECPEHDTNHLWGRKK